MAKIVVDVDDVFGWGVNNFGPLGTGNVATFNCITELQHNDMDKIIVGINSSTAYIKNNGDLWMSGVNDIGQFGNGAATNANSPVQIPGKFKCVSGNNIDCRSNLFIKQDNTLWAAGNNCYGQLGQSNSTHQSSMVQVPGNWISIGTGARSSFGIKSDCTAWGWGYNFCGILGNESVEHTSSPVQIPGTWIQIASLGGEFTSFGIKTDCTLWAWGRNPSGALGINISEIDYSISSPIQIPGTWICVSVGSCAIAAIKSDCTLWTWGSGSSGKLGNYSVGNQSSPVQVPGTWKMVSMGVTSATGIKSDGTLWSWGGGPRGVSPNVCVSSPIQIPGNYTYTSTGCCNNIVMNKICKEYNKNDNSGIWDIQGIYEQKISDTWSDFIPTIDD